MIFSEWYKKYYSILFFVLAAFTGMLMLPAEGKFKYEYQKGRPWLYETLIAPVDFPILKSEQELRAERSMAASKSPACYNVEQEAMISTREELLTFFSSLSSDSLILLDSRVAYLYDKGITERMDGGNPLSRVLISDNNFTLKERPAAEIFSIESAIAFINEFATLSRDKLTKLESLIKPNLIYDKEATELARREAVQKISPTKGVLYAGQVIVAQGEIITAEIEQLLDSYKAEYEISMGFSGSLLVLKSGQLLICLALFLLLYITLYFTKREILKEKRKLLFVLMLVLFSILVTVVVRGISPSYLFIIPFSVFALYLCSFFNTKMVLPVYIVIILPVVTIAQNGAEIFMLNLFAGSITILAYTYWDKGWMQFAVAFAVFMTLSLSYIAFRMVEDGTLLEINRNTLSYFAWNAILIVATYPLIYLFEKIYGLVSNQRLKDLADTDSKLLREMSDKAPGSFQHILQVASLAESGVSAIGGYSLLARVGALYHDIGKIENPMLFIENQPAGAKNIHEELEPAESAKLIIKHVQDGLDIAKRERLPQIIKDFILSHHGKSKTLYFYKKHINSGGDPSDAHLFTYEGIMPKYKEQVVVMMADAVEAASRSLRDYSEESISGLVERVVEERISDGQLLEAEISLKEIKMVKDVFKQRLSGMYHSRMVKPL